MDGKKIAHETGGLLFIFWGLFVLLSLSSFDASDPSLNHVVSGNVPIHNNAGIFGAYLSGFLHDLFGIGAYIWPLVFLLMGGAMVSSLFDLPWWRWCGGFLLAVCLLVAAEAFSLSIGDMAGGGIAGRGLYENARRFLSPGGSSLLWAFLLLAGIQLNFDFSWLSLLRRVSCRFNSSCPASGQETAGRRETEKPHSASAPQLPALSAWGSVKNFLQCHFTGRRSIRSSPSMPTLHDAETEQVTQQPAPAVNSIVDSTLFTPHGERIPLEESLPTPQEDIPLADTQAEEETQPARLVPPPQKIGQVRLVPEAHSPSRKGNVPLPSLQLLTPPKTAEGRPDAGLLSKRGEMLINCLKDFDIEGELSRITPGPVVTMFEVRPAPGIRVSRISNLSDDLALSLKALSVRIEAPIPGSDTVGIEIPNENRETVNFRELLASNAFGEKDALAMALGKNIAGRPVVADLSCMPHLLVAGATGAGKSVCLNSILLSFLYKLHPSNLQLLLVDPKRIELAVYADLPHLVHPVVTDTAQAKTALDWAVHEMDKRFENIARLGARGIAGYNQKLHSYGKERPADIQDLEQLPYLVIIIDELADLMLTAAREVETSIVRLAQLARAAGIHMILATQRPSVDVVTGLIKANFPCRISFQVTSRHDSRTILDSNGAEHLLGKGDMLFKPSGGKLQRLHGPFVSDEEVTAVVKHWKRHLPPSYRVNFSEWGNEVAESQIGGGSDASNDPLYPEAQNFVRDQGKASISLLQRRFRIGFNRAARIMEQLERDGIISQGEDGKSRRIVR